MANKGIKQWRLPFIGIFYDVFIMTSPIMAPISYLMLSSTAYAVTREYLLALLPWLNYAIFLGALITFYLMGMMIVYTFVYHSYFAHRNRQEYEHSNPIRRDIKAVKDDIRRLEEKFDQLTNQAAVGEGAREASIVTQGVRNIIQDGGKNAR